jgi:hypothetical protein
MPTVNPMAEGRALLHVWVVDPAEAVAGIDRLDALLMRISADGGFISASVLESQDRTSSCAAPGTAGEASAPRAVRETHDHLDGTMNLVVRLHQQVKACPA